MKTCAYIIVLILSFNNLVMMAQCDYEFSSDGNWSNSANWSGGSVPANPLASGETVCILGKVTIDTDVIVNGTINLDNKEIIDIATGVTLTIGNSGKILSTKKGMKQITGSVLNNGTIDITEIKGITGSITNNNNITLVKDLVVESAGTVINNGSISAGKINIDGAGASFTSYGGFSTSSNFKIQYGGSATIFGDNNFVGNDLSVNHDGTTIQINGLMEVEDDLKVKYGGASIFGTGGICVCDKSGGEKESLIENEGTISLAINMCNTNDENTVDNNGTITPGITYGSDCSNTLPIQLLTFEAIKNANNITLKWSTASELNNSHFIIQKLDNFSNSWESLGEILGSGSSEEIHNYTFIDNSEPQKVNYYRLVQVDFDGTQSISNVISIENSKNQVLFSLYPNPSKGKVSIIIEDTQIIQAKITVYSIDGNVELSKEFNNFSEDISFNVSQLDKGLYIVKLTTNSGLSIRKLKVY